MYPDTMSLDTSPDFPTDAARFLDIAKFVEVKFTNRVSGVSLKKIVIKGSR